MNRYKAQKRPITVAKWNFDTDFGVFEKKVKRDISEAIDESFAIDPPVIHIEGANRGKFPSKAGDISVRLYIFSNEHPGCAPEWRANLADIVEDAMEFLVESPDTAKPLSALLRKLADKIDAGLDTYAKGEWPSQTFRNYINAPR